MLQSGGALIGYHDSAGLNLELMIITSSLHTNPPAVTIQLDFKSDFTLLSVCAHNQNNNFKKISKAPSHNLFLI